MLKYYEAGMDVGLSNDIRESFKLFQARIMREYDSMVDEFGLTIIDGTRSIEEQQSEVRKIVATHLESYTGINKDRKEATNECISLLR